MGIRISSIQSRDQVDIQNPQAGPKTPLIRNDSPILENLGAPLEKYADFIQKKEASALKNAQNIRSAMVRNKFADFENQATTKVLDAQGENTFTATDSAGKELKKNLEKELSQFPPQYRTEYANFAQDSIQRFNKTSQGRMISEGRKAGEEAFKRRSEDLTGQVVLNAYDRDAMQTYLLDLDKTVEQHSELTIGSESPRAKELIDIHKKEAKSTAIVKTIETLAASGDVAKAGEIALEYNDSLTAGDLTKAYGYLKEGKKKRDLDGAKSEADQAMSIYTTGGERAAQQYLASITDGDKYKLAKGMFDGMVAADLRITDRERKDKVAKVEEIIRKNHAEGKSNLLDTETLNTLDSKDAAEVLAYARDVSMGKETQTDSATYNRLYNKWISNPSAFATENLSWYSSKLNRSDRMRLEGLQKLEVEPNTGEMRARDFNYVADEIIKAEVAPTAKIGSKKYLDQSAQIREATLTAFNNAINKLGPRAGKQEVYNEMKKELSTSTLERKDARNLWDRFLGRPKEMEVVPSRTQRNEGTRNRAESRVKVEDFSPELVKEITRRTTEKLGRAPTKAELEQRLQFGFDNGHIQKNR